MPGTEDPAYFLGKATTALILRALSCGPCLLFKEINVKSKRSNEELNTMSRRNHVQGRRDDAEPRERSQSEVGASSNDPKPFPTSRLPQEPAYEDANEGGGGELHRYAQVVAHHPVATLVASFSVGFGLGILATAILGRHERKSTAGQSDTTFLNRSTTSPPASAGSRG